MVEFLSDEIDFSAYMAESEPKTKVLPAGSWSTDLAERLRHKATEKRVFLPWEKTISNFAFRPGEVTLWSGQNGHGKSLMVTQQTLSLIGQGEKVCVASFEMKPVTTLERMTRMYCGTNPFSPEFQQGAGLDALDALYAEFFSWVDGRLWMYDQMGTAAAGTVIGMVRYCAKELGIGHVVVDNLAKCVRGEDDYNGQKLFVDELTAVARDYSCHVHLVHHLKKPAKETDVPDKHDNKGSGAITDQVDNVLMVWRNKAKEDDVKLHGQLSAKRNDPDQYLLCRKQRNYDGSGEGEPSVQLWFSRDAQQYVANGGDAPQFFPNWPHEQTRF